MGTATTAYQQGKITKSQYIAVIHALDENTWTQSVRTSKGGQKGNALHVQTTASVETPGQA